MITYSLLEMAVGLAAGVASGAFGVGGGVVTTPAIRLLLGYPELVAVGTPLPVILPTAIAGALTHIRFGRADLRTGFTVGLWGLPATVAGALLTRVLGGSVVLLITAAVVVLAAIDILRPTRPLAATVDSRALTPASELAALIGLGTGFYTGMLGLGGGFILVPLLRRFTDLTAKGAIGTSLVAVAVLAVPGSITHWAIGNVDLPLALSLSVGVIPGAVLGARLTVIARELHVRVAFAIFLAIVGITLGLTEAGLL